MNILPHKSWHVYNKKNIERVRRDEAKAREEEAAKADRAAKAESEARLNLLRQRAASRQLTTGQEGALIKPVETFNLFSESDQNRYAQNEEHVAEQKAKEEKWERQATMYLDKGVKGDDVPWYAKNEYDRYGGKLKNDKGSEKGHRRRRSPIRVHEDPLVEIRTQLEKEERSEKEKHKKRARHDDDSDRKKKKKSSKSTTESSSSSSSIEMLRRQRLEREMAERARTRALIYGEEDVHSEDHDQQQYHSQFNPQETAEAKKRHKRRS